MSNCDQIRSDAAGLVTLAEGDADRVAAFAHAEACEGCATALAEGDQLRLFLAEFPAEPVCPDVLQNARAAVLSEWDAESQLQTVPSASASWLPRLLLPLTILAAGAGMLALAKHTNAGSLPYSLAFLGVAVLLGGFIDKLSKALVGVSIVASAAFSLAMSHGPTMAQAHGLHCIGAELAIVAIPLIAMSFMVATGRFRSSSRWGLMATAGVAGLAGQASLHAACAGHSLLHLGAFHTGGVVVAIALAAAISFIPQLRGANTDTA
jgi:hypothetical protein